MPDYEKLYYSMFNAVSEALEQLIKQNYGNGITLLKEAQWKCEEAYIESEEWEICEKQ